MLLTANEAYIYSDTNAEVVEAAAKQAVDNDIIEIIQEEIKPGVIEQYVNELPTKLLALGIKVLIAIIVLFVGIKLINIVRKIVRKAFEKTNAEKGVIQFIDSLIKAVLSVLLFLSIAINFGVEATSIAALIGSVSIAIGLALQGSLSNFAGGILILLLKPFRVGDFIKEDSHGNEGTVHEISLFYTKLLTYDNKTVILPNGTLANTSMVNYTHAGNRRMDIRIGISYESDIKKARKIILELIEADDRILQDMQKIVFVAELGESSVNLGVRCFIPIDDYWDVLWKLQEDVKCAFDDAGIKIPYKQIDIHMDK